MSAIETCLSKQVFRTKQDAKRKIRSSNRKWLDAYHCRVCQNYHLGHRRYRPFWLIEVEEFNANLQS